MCFEKCKCFLSFVNIVQSLYIKGCNSKKFCFHNEGLDFLLPVWALKLALSRVFSLLLLSYGFVSLVFFFFLVTSVKPILSSVVACIFSYTGWFVVSIISVGDSN